VNLRVVVNESQVLAVRSRVDEFHAGSVDGCFHEVNGRARKDLEVSKG
jgi:hypothetical protein